MRRIELAGAIALAFLSGCAGSGSGDDVSPSGIPPLTIEQLQNPESCKDCHPTHYREWASSMHAYAADDPVFLAMNRRGQEETDGALGDFCVDCHAPMATRVENPITDFANLEQLPKELKGVTCYFCHNAVGVGDHFNNGLMLANDTVMRGGICDPVRTSAHGAECTPFHDRDDMQSSIMCGSCHDVKTPDGAHIERTLAEYLTSAVAKLPANNGFQTCQSCHMDGREGVAAQDPDVRVFQRRISEHLWPGVDVALTEFPDRELQRIRVECALALSTRVTIEPYAEGPGTFRVLLETDAAHNQPSGAAQDRRMWVEVKGYDASDNVIYASGDIADDQDEREKPDTWMFRDHIFGADGEEVHMFWEAAPSAMHPKGFESGTLPPATDVTMPHALGRIYPIGHPQLARVTVRVRMRPMGHDVLKDLIDSDHLDPEVLAAMPTFTLSETEWILADGNATIMDRTDPPTHCPDAYLCLLEGPESRYCED